MIDHLCDEKHLHQILQAGLDSSMRVGGIRRLVSKDSVGMSRLGFAVVKQATSEQTPCIRLRLISIEFGQGHRGGRKEEMSA